MKNKKDEKKEPKIIGRFVLDVHDDGTTKASFPNNINPNFLRIELTKYLNIVADQCVIDKLIEMESRVKIFKPNQMPIPNMKLNSVV